MTLPVHVVDLQPADVVRLSRMAALPLRGVVLMCRPLVRSTFLRAYCNSAENAKTTHFGFENVPENEKQSRGEKYKYSDGTSTFLLAVCRRFLTRR